MKILVTGINGQLGYDVCRVLERRGIEHIGAARRDFDLTDAAAAERFVRACQPDAVIHCSAWTAVDRAEDEPEAARAVNVRGTQALARLCRDVGARMLYLSTDYVFPGEGQRPYEPDDPTGPLNVYGLTKLQGEEALRETLEEHFIVRTSWVFGVNGSNFVKTMLRLAETHPTLRVVNDQVGSPTYTADLAELLCDMIVTERYGSYHATNEGFCSWAEFAGEIFRQAGKSVEVIPVSTEEYPTRARRPLNSRLSKDKLEQNGFRRLPDWQDALSRYLRELA